MAKKTQSDRARAQASGQSKYPVASLSPHQVGLGVDFGPNQNAPNNDAIHNALIASGLVNNVPGDPPHYSTPDARHSQTRALADAYEAAYNAYRVRQ